MSTSSSEPFAGRRQHQAFADAEEEGGAEPRLDVAQLMAEGRLREVQPIAGARQAADVGDRRDQPQVANLDLHVNEATSSS
jgi:hypothetical protein